MKSELFKIKLPKWPAFIVDGDPVSKEQAAEILVRTNAYGLYFDCNDKKWVKLIKNYVGMEVAESSFSGDNAERLKNELGILDLEYIGNSRVATSYVNGPHGWVDWDGNVGCDSFNIGKWPSVERTYDEWKQIAKAFPYLNLKCQLLSGESCEEDIFPLVEYHIKNGKVIVKKPGKLLKPKFSGSSFSDSEEDFIKMLKDRTNSYERGCTFETFKDAIDLVRNKFKE